MNNKAKRIFIGLLLPTIVTVLVAGGFFYKNAYGNLVKLKQEAEEKEAKDNAIGVVKITKANWQDYFTIEIKEEREYNSDDELVRIRYNSVITLKEEYHDKVVYSDDKRNELILNGYLHTEHMIYEITDAKNSRWEVIKEYHGMKPKGDSDYFTQSWWMTNEEDFVTEYEFESYSKSNKLYVEIPEEFKVEAAAGILYFEE